MEILQDLFSLIGRVLISVVFLIAAYEKVTNWHQTVSYMKSKNVPHLNIVLPIAVGLKGLGGILVLLGWHVHFGALLLLIVAIASLVYMHDWWKKHGTEREMEKLLFFKDLAIVGGLFMIFALGAGRFGVH